MKLQEKKKLVFDGTVGGTRYVCVKCMYVFIILDPTNLPRPSARRVRVLVCIYVCFVCTYLIVFTVYIILSVCMYVCMPHVGM